jgi:hypothetical protein
MNMSDDNRVRKDFDCEHCWPASPDAAWESRLALDWQVDLIDESHFHVMILACRSCTQSFVSVFTETIDWVDGQNPQYCMLLPLTEEEATGVVH